MGQAKTYKQLTGCVRSRGHLHSRRLPVQDRRQPLTASPCQPAIQAYLCNRHHRNILRLLRRFSPCGGYSPHRDTLAIRPE
jgi:hypothetical protein